MATADQRHHCFHRHVLLRPRHFRVWLVITKASFPHRLLHPAETCVQRAPWNR